MKIVFITGCLVFSLLIGFPIDSYSQYIVAGEFSSGNYFHDINPDTTLKGPNNHFTTFPAAVYSIDIDGDGIRDFFLYAYGDWTNGMGASEISIHGDTTAICQVAFGNYDTCHTPNSTYLLYRMAKSFRKDDTISSKLVWSTDGLFLTYTFWGDFEFSCNHNGFINDSLGNYLGIRVISPSDTIYGWIKITNINFLSYTVQEFAGSKNNTVVNQPTSFMKIFPIPTSGKVSIETQFPDFNLVVYNPYGMEMIHKHQIQAKTIIDLSNKANGVYIFKFFRDNSIIIKKVIKL